MGVVMEGPNRPAVQESIQDGNSTPCLACVDRGNYIPPIGALQGGASALLIGYFFGRLLLSSAASAPRNSITAISNGQVAGNMITNTASFLTIFSLISAVQQAWMPNTFPGVYGIPICSAVKHTIYPFYDFFSIIIRVHPQKRQSRFGRT